MWREVEKIIDMYESFMITAHVNPDGDAIGSEMALKAFLEDRDKDVVVVNASPTPASVAFLDPENEIKVFATDVTKAILDDVDAIFILDLNNWEQLGFLAKPIQQSALPRICIDHHQGVDQDFADVIVSDTSASATGMLVFEMIEALGGNISRQIADACYAAIIADTGTFRFSNTDVRTFLAAARLTEHGVSPFEVHKQVFASKGWGAGKLLGPVMQTVDQAADGRLAWMYATQKMVHEAGATYDDMDGFVDLVRSIKGVELVLFFKETPDAKVIKVSLRSNGTVDAYAIASHFGGGGHKMASGMRLEGPLDDAIKSAVEACIQMDGIRQP